MNNELFVQECAEIGKQKMTRKKNYKNKKTRRRNHIRSKKKYGKCTIYKRKRRKTE